MLCRPEAPGAEPGCAEPRCAEPDRAAPGRAVLRRAVAWTAGREVLPDPGCGRGWGFRLVLMGVIRDG
ncbi:hypothetical protein Acy02nite_29080 [Actinoplanes cyaneus]|uniref:Uncharacterized protein n=1 Tax=Actinoplanes cyaneus TaxID=52696 RepID=A0A919IIK8_9ACTN|nr:hypothetical protein Acy02nite_29080 [Actinoplanes cyaneus]